MKKKLLNIYHVIQYIMCFFLLFIIGKTDIAFLYSHVGVLLLILASAYLTIWHYTPGDGPWWWLPVKEKLHEKHGRKES